MIIFIRSLVLLIIMIDEIKEKARKVFDPWFELIAKQNEIENKERLFEIFYSGYLAGTRYKSGEVKRNRDISSIIIDDVNRNLDL
jgi:hypothetical protein